MKHFFVPVFGFLLSLGTVLAAPRISVDRAIYDFGEVVEGFLVQHSFVLTNTGDEPLVFTHRPTTTCGCTVADLPKEVLEPGESMELVAIFDSTGFGGRKVTKGIYVFTNDPQTPELRLYIKGYVRPAAEYQFSARYLRYDFYVLIDLRSPEEYGRGHLLGAIDVPFEELEQRVASFPTDTVIYLYDLDGGLASRAAELLVGKGYRFARGLAGGLIGWREALGDAFLVWGPEGAVPYGGEPKQGPYTVAPEYFAGDYTVILDLRPPEEYAASHLPGALNVDPATLPQWAGENLPKAAELPEGVRYTVWCVDGDGTVACSAAQYLRSQGYPAVCMVGGLPQWVLRYGDSLLVTGG